MLYDDLVLIFKEVNQREPNKSEATTIEQYAKRSLVPIRLSKWIAKNPDHPVAARILRWKY